MAYAVTRSAAVVTATGAGREAAFIAAALNHLAFDRQDRALGCLIEAAHRWGRL